MARCVQLIVTLNSSTFTNVITPIPCDSISVESLSDSINIYLQTDTSDTATRRIILPRGTAEYGHRHLRADGAYRFLPTANGGVSEFSLKSASGAPDVLLTFVR
jgi:hypothetical protein